jgi:hypothetical protein
VDSLLGLALAHPAQAPLHHLGTGRLQVGEHEKQAIFQRRQGAVLIHAKLAGSPGFAIEASGRPMGLEGGFAGRHQLLKLVERHAGEIQELHGAGLLIGKPYTGHAWCLLSWEAQYTISRDSLNCRWYLVPQRLMRTLPVVQLKELF